MDLLSRIQNRLTPMDPIPTGMASAGTVLTDVRAVIFDVYGTLFASGSGDIGVAAANDSDRALGEALVAAGLSVDAARVADWIQGVRASHETSRTAGIAYPEIEVRDVWRRVLSTPATAQQIEILAVEYECRVNPVWPMPGLVNTLSRLRSGQFVLGIVSNAQFYTPLLFEACLGRSVGDLGFTESLCAWSYQLREAKPSPRMFEPIVAGLGRIGILPHQAVYVGNDLLNDAWTASQAGLRTCLFAGDRRSLRLRESDQRCHGLRPDCVVTSLDEICGLLES